MNLPIKEKKYYLRPLLIILIVMVSAWNVTAQRTITGTITDAEDSTPLIGASIFIKGTTVGTVTDLDGNYTLNINSDEDIITFQYVGYLSREIMAGSQSVIDVELVPSYEELDEVVVIGYGTVKKSDLTGAVAVVSSEELEKSNNVSLSHALQGKAAGVYVTTNSGQPGSGVSIRVRGVGSINRNAQPLVVIDGIPGGGSINDLHPEDIESVQILKDASATAIYGADGSNGVILIQTKKGSTGEPQIHLRAKVGLATIPKQMDILDADEYVQFYTEAYEYYNQTHIVPRTFPDAYTPERRAEFGNIYTNWQDLITVSPALSQDYHISASGGNDKATYRISGNVVDEEGTLMTTWRKLFSLKANSTYNIGKNIRVGETLTFHNSSSRRNGSAQGNPWLTSVICSPLMPVYNEDAAGGFQGPDEYITGPNERTNTYAEMTLNNYQSRGNNFYGSMYGEWDFYKGFTFKSTLGLIYNDNRGTDWRPVYDLAQRSNPINSLSESDSEYRKWVWDNQLTYTNTFGKNNITATAVHSMQDSYSNWFRATTRNLDYENLQVLTQGDPEEASVNQWKTPDKFESYLGRLMYDYAGKYYLTASIRRDGSSRFGKKNRWGNFPSFSLAWKINEDLLQQVDQLNMWKVRFGWGKTGNADIGTFVYDATISTASQHVYTLGDYNLGTETAIYGAAPFYNIPSPDIKWEASTMINVGTDLSAFNNRLQFSTEYYYKRQDELLVQLPLPLISGMSGDATPPWVNLGEIHNTGVEFNASWRQMTGDFTYEVSANLTTIKNVVDHLPSGDIIQGNNTALVGHSIGALYGYVAERILQVEDFETDEDGIPIQNPEDGSYTILHADQQDLTAPGDIKFKDLNNDGKINALDRTLIGKVIPDFTYGINFSCYYKGIDFTLFLTGVNNVDVYNHYRSQAGIASGDFHVKDENKLSEVLDYWTPENRSNSQTRISLEDENFNGEWFSSWWVEDASYLRIRDVQLGYTLPARWTNVIGISNLRLYTAAVNLYTFTKYTGYDPEVASSDPLSTNIDSGHYPVPRTIYFGITADF